jgi:hypothetical protein
VFVSVSRGTLPVPQVFGLRPLHQGKAEPRNAVDRRLTWTRSRYLFAALMTRVSKSLLNCASGPLVVRKVFKLWGAVPVDPGSFGQVHFRANKSLYVWFLTFENKCRVPDK